MCEMRRWKIQGRRQRSVRLNRTRSFLCHCQRFKTACEDQYRRDHVLLMKMVDDMWKVRDATTESRTAFLALELDYGTPNAKYGRRTKTASTGLHYSGHLHHSAGFFSYTTLFTRLPSPWLITIRTSSPCLKKTGGVLLTPIPCGVPVKITVPASNVVP